MDIAAVIDHYIATLLWTQSCNGTAPSDVCDHHGRGEDCDTSLGDLNYGTDDLANSAKLEVSADVIDFVQSNLTDLKGLDESDIGHNFLLSRNGHGTGFWDRGLGDRGDRLHAATKPYGETYAYVSNESVYVD